MSVDDLWCTESDDDRPVMLVPVDGDADQVALNVARRLAELLPVYNVQVIAGLRGGVAVIPQKLPQHPVDAMADVLRQAGLLTSGEVDA